MRSANIVRATHQIEAPVFSLSARVEVDFTGTYDAGALFVACDDDHWAKLAYEQSAQGHPTLVSVVTRKLSDDADGPIKDRGPVWLRLYCNGPVIAFHDSLDGTAWRFRRVFTLPGIERRPLTIGFGAQSPIGEGVRAAFDRIELHHEAIVNLRDGS